jgi:hypothetical protein
MGYMYYTKDRLERMYKEGDYSLGTWSPNGPLYLERYKEYIKWITDYEQNWGNVEGRYYVLFDYEQEFIHSIVVKGNFIVGELYPNGEIKYVKARRLLGKKDIKVKKPAGPEEMELETVSYDKDLLDKIERDLAAIIQRIESSFMVPSNFFEKN